MTKNEYIDFIRNSLPMEDKTDKFHPAQVEAAINLAVNTAFYEMYAKNPKVMAKSLERYSTLIWSAIFNTVRPPRYTASLTVDIVDLPRKTGGILEISDSGFDMGGTDPILATTTKFLPLTTMEGEQLYGAEAVLASNEYGFSFAGGGSRVIEFWGSAAGFAAMFGVWIRAIKQFKSYSSTSQVLLPYGQDERIIELVRQYLGVIPPKDLINDNADSGMSGGRVN